MAACMAESRPNVTISRIFRNTQRHGKAAQVAKILDSQGVIRIASFHLVTLLTVMSWASTPTIKKGPLQLNGHPL
jgi:hypothetical protein